jgi:hypothetical protein
MADSLITLPASPINDDRRDDEVEKEVSRADIGAILT